MFSFSGGEGKGGLASVSEFVLTKNLNLKYFFFYCEGGGRGCKGEGGE